MNIQNTSHLVSEQQETLKTTTTSGELQQKKIDSQEKNREFFVDLKLLLDIEDKQIQEIAMRNFAQKRVDELQKSVNEAQSNISILNKKNQTDFILPETQIKRNMIADGFQINDQEVYVALLQSIANIHASW